VGLPLLPYDLFRSRHISSGQKLHPDEDECAKKDGLYPIQALAQPISQRFKYHFEGPRHTNKLDKVTPIFFGNLDSENSLLLARMVLLTHSQRLS
jgi:hypothetical protein